MISRVSIRHFIESVNYYLARAGILSDKINFMMILYITRNLVAINNY